MEVDEVAEPDADIAVIDLHLCHGKVLAWNAQDVKVLREVHHIVGSLIGSLPRAPRQNSLMGLPLQLMPEEANVLLEYGAARLVNIKTHKPNAEQAATFEDNRKDSFRKQKELWTMKQIQKKDELSHIIGIGRMSRKQRRAEKAMKRRLQQETAKLKLQKEESSNAESHDQSAEHTNQLSHVESHDQSPGPTNKISAQEVEVKTVRLENSHLKKEDVICKATVSQAKLEDTEGGDECQSNDMTVGETTKKSLDTCDVGTNVHKVTEHCDMLDNPAHSDKLQSQDMMTDKMMKEDSTVPMDPKNVEHSLDDNNDMPVESNRTYEQGGIRSSNDPECTNSPVGGVTVESCEKDLIGSTGRVGEPGISTEDNGVGKPSGDEVYHEASCDVPGHDEDGETKPKNYLDETDGHVENQDKTEKQKDEDQGCLIQLFTGTPNVSPRSVQIPDWDFPKTTDEIVRCQVFQSFWEQGYYLTSGSKFGGDFLAYPGDPFLYHSFYIIVCLPYKKTISALDMVAWGRMASNVKKTVVLCSVDETDEVVYTSVQWTGIT